MLAECFLFCYLVLPPCGRPTPTLPYSLSKDLAPYSITLMHTHGLQSYRLHPIPSPLQTYLRVTDMRKALIALVYCKLHTVNGIYTIIHRNVYAFTLLIRIDYFHRFLPNIYFHTPLSNVQRTSSIVKLTGYRRYTTVITPFNEFFF